MSNGDIAAPFLMVLFLLLAAEKETPQMGQLWSFLFRDDFIIAHITSNLARTTKKNH